MILEDKLYSERELAKLLGYHVQTLKNLRRDGKIEFCRLNGRTVKYDRTQIENYLKEQLVRAA